MTFAWEISTIALILVLLISPQTSYVWQNTERFAGSKLVAGFELQYVDGCFLIRALYRGGFGNNELHYYLTNLVTGERVEVCRGKAVADYLKVH